VEYEAKIKELKAEVDLDSDTFAAKLI